jgi:hypothetical protein
VEEGFLFVSRLPEVILRKVSKRRIAGGPRGRVLRKTTA